MIRIREFGSRWNNNLELNAKKAWLSQTQYFTRDKNNGTPNYKKIS